MQRPQIRFQHSHTQEEEIGLLEALDQEKVLIVHNDDHNTFDWVIASLIQVCGHHQEQAEQCTYIIHFNGKCQVSHGPEDMLQKKYLALVQRGLTATLE
jgi:ATP-dependent Clp protease adaptor protein ClpS